MPAGYTIAPNEPALAAALDAIRYWADSSELVSFALSRHGYCDTDGFFGITYPDDLDEYDKVVLGEDIPEGFVEAIAWYGEHQGPSYLLEETTYREILRQDLVVRNEFDLANELCHPTVKAVIHLPGPIEQAIEP